MNTNSRFAVAIHILTLLASQPDKVLTSGEIACSVTTNPVVIRRILGHLRRAGLVRSQSGLGGGWQLARVPEQITLQDAYRALREGSLFPFPPQSPNAACCIGKTVQRVLVSVFEAGETALEQEFARVTLADVLARVQQA